MVGKQFAYNSTHRNGREIKRTNLSSGKNAYLTNEGVEKKQSKKNKAITLCNNALPCARALDNQPAILQLEAKLKRIRRQRNGFIKKMERQARHEDRLGNSPIIAAQHKKERRERIKLYKKIHVRESNRARHEIPVELIERRQRRREEIALKRKVKKVIDYHLRHSDDLVPVTMALLNDAQRGDLQKISTYKEPTYESASTLRRKAQRYLSSTARHHVDPTPGVVQWVLDAFRDHPFRICTYQKLAGARM